MSILPDMSDERHFSSSHKTPTPEALLRAMVDSSDDAIVTQDHDRIITSWNRSAERIFGYTAQEIIGQSMSVLVPSQQREEERDIIRRIRDGERVDHLETVRRRKDGGKVDVTVSTSPIFDVDGAIMGASVVLRDIGETKRAIRVDQLLAAIVSSSDDAIVSKNLDSTITSWNAGAERVFGYTAAEMVGQSVLKLIPADRKEEEPKIIARLQRGERVEHFETVRVTKSGRHIDVSLTISPVRDGDGRIVGASKIARDITEAKRIAAERETLLESERQARAQAEHANRTKDDFLATVSHELRTPLNAIVGWTDVLQGGGNTRDDVVHGIEVIRKNAMMQAQLIEDLLDLGRITSGKMVLDVEWLDIATIVRAAMSSVQHAADAKQISLQATFGAFQGGLRGDAKRLQQVVWNLLTNAIKFTDSGGRVSVDVALAGPNVNVIVTDNGQGMAPEFLAHAFERFRQADTSITRKHGGLGIGLALVKQLVELHGGGVTAWSAGLGHGSIFTVTLPLVTTRSNRVVGSSESDSGQSPLADLTGIKVLILDDDRDSLEVVGRILNARRAEIRTASSVDEAQVLWGTFSPDVVLSDIGMPKRDGYDFIRRLREHSSLAGVPAVALTALARAEDRTRALNAGFQAHLAKPVAAAELVAIVRSLGRLHSAQGDSSTSRARSWSH